MSRRPELRAAPSHTRSDSSRKADAEPVGSRSLCSGGQSIGADPPTVSQAEYPVPKAPARPWIRGVFFFETERRAPNCGVILTIHAVRPTAGLARRRPHLRQAGRTVPC